MSIWGSFYFQNGVSLIMEHLIFFHDHTMMIMIMIMIMVGYILYDSCVMMFYNNGLFEGQELESIWTIFPIIFLLFIAFPSLRLLYLMEEEDSYELSIKVMGHQWYWEYEYMNMDNMMFDSYMDQEESMFRLLNVDNSLIFPINTNVRMIVSSVDVIHSWAMPSLGVKMDAIPGRLNQMNLMFNRLGMYFGQCSEICGANHSFMPILVYIIPRMNFLYMM